MKTPFLLSILIHLQLFNTNIDALYPEFWATAFDEMDKGQYNLQNQISRKYENQLGRNGDTVNVPVTPSFTAGDWVPGNAISANSVTQETVPVILNKSKSVPFGLNGMEMSMTPYELIRDYGVPAAEAILAQLNLDVYQEMLASQYLIDATSGLTESKIIDAGAALSNRKIGNQGRVITASPDDIATLMKLSAFSQADITGRTDVVIDGLITKRYGFDFFENNAISKYTPTDLVGAVNNGAGYAAGATSMVVNGFNDDTNPIRKGDVFTVAGDSVQHVVQTVTASSGDTIGLTFLPALGASVVDTAVITVVATKSLLAFVPSATALAARPYALLPEKSGVMSMIVNYQGIPIRISVFHDGKLGLTVQYDILYGVKNIDTRRIQRIITV